ncbi:MAG TPA: sigma-70 family RNA polymerase sigma factor [Candidatus Dormibacteraeota bacterium]|nr:sigma-70 family RNA polymerase sigma factor [Candidatus Dormibacteraeota bacterium]
MTDDYQLLRRYAEESSEEAFRELVARNLNLVYSIALRRTGGDSHLAQDVAQLVFADFARKAASLPRNVVIAGWLHRASRFAAAQAIRAERRRRAREQEAVTMNFLPTDPASDWDQIRPLLDRALDKLARQDRDALLLRFVEQRSLAEVGRALGTSEDTARKRVSRALEKLRKRLVRLGVTTSGAALAMAITANAVHTAPAGLAVALTTSSLASAATAAGTTLTSLKLLTMTTLHKTVAASAMVVALGAALYQTRQNFQLRQQNQSIQQQQGPSAKQVYALQQERDDATNRLRALLAERSSRQANTNTSELLRLRAEVASLRRQAAERNQSQFDRSLSSAPIPQSPANAAEFESVQRQLSFAMHRVENALRQFATNTPYGTILDANGKANPQVFAGFPGLPLDDLDLKVQDVQTLANALDQHSHLILATTKNPIYFDGIWTRFYLLADGTIRSDTSLSSEQQFKIVYPSDEDLDAMRQTALANNNLPEKIKRIRAVLEPAMQAFSAANNSRSPDDPSQLMPYITTPEQQEALQEVTQWKQNQGSLPLDRPSR